MLLDSQLQLVCIPVDKLRKALDMIYMFMAAKKVTVHQVQKLCGFLNFLCRCIIPGRAFTRRLYSLTQGKNHLKPHHHVKVSKEYKLDLEVWNKFLSKPEIFYRPFMDSEELNAQDILMYSDASRNFHKGFGAWCQNSWMVGAWNPRFMEHAEPSIEYLELFGVCAAVLTWIDRFSNMKIRLFCDNESVVHMLNNSSSKCRNCMVLIRFITLKGLVHNVRIFGKHVRTEKNGIADSLSRLQFTRFQRIKGKNFDDKPTKIPQEIWPMHKIWLD